MLSSRVNDDECSGVFSSTIPHLVSMFGVSCQPQGEQPPEQPLQREREY
jgi:hypothetical protein